MRTLHEQERSVAFQAYLGSAEGRRKYEKAYKLLLAFYKVTDPHRFEKAANEAAIARIERLDFQFPEYAAWLLSKRNGVPESAT